MTSPVPVPVTSALRPGSAVSSDGASIGWFSIGTGPGIVVLHGAMQAARSQLDLARLLAATHEVHLVDRRGRGRSGPYPAAPPYTEVEVADLACVLAATGARAVLGVSSGAVVALRAALVLPALERVAAFEPPLAVDGSIRLDLVRRFELELDGGHLPDAMVTAMLVAEMGPPILLRAPRPVLRPMTRRMLAADRPVTGHPGDPGSRDLVAALRYDFGLVTENADRLDDLSAVRARTLLLDGARTRPYLRTAVEALARVIPGSRRVTLPGANHGATQNRGQWGRPDRVAPALLEFFAG